MLLFFIILAVLVWWVLSKVIKASHQRKEEEKRRAQIEKANAEALARKAEEQQREQKIIQDPQFQEKLVRMMEAWCLLLYVLREGNAAQTEKAQRVRGTCRYRIQRDNMRRGACPDEQVLWAARQCGRISADDKRLYEVNIP